MTGRYLNSRFAPSRHSPGYRADVASSMWLRAGLVALSVAAIALIMLATGEASPLSAITSAVAGGVLATLAWRRARTILDDDDAVKGNGSPGAMSVTQRVAGLGARVESAASH